MISVILPTYNEAGNIVPLVKAIMARMPQGKEYEILVVDDHSPDGTHDIAKKEFAGDKRVVTILRHTDRGLAKSIWAGIEQAKGDQIVVMDTDFTHDPAEIPKLLHVGEIYDIVIGSRFCSGGNMQDYYHYVTSFIYNLVLRVCLHSQIQDNLGGYFTMKKSKILPLPIHLIFYGYGDYFFRLLHFAKRQGMSVVELPVYYKVRTYGTSKSSVIKMLYSYTRAAIKLKAFKK